MSIEPRDEDRTAPAWPARLDEAARRTAAEFARLFTGPDGRQRAAGIVVGLARQAIRPEAEVRTRQATRLADGRVVECITGPGVLRLAFEGEVGDWTEPATAARIVATVRAAVAAELRLSPIVVGLDRWGGDGA